MKKVSKILEKFVDFVDNTANVLTEPDTRIYDKVSVYLNINNISNTVLGIWEEGTKNDLYPLLITHKTMSYIIKDLKVEVNIEKREILSYRNGSLITFEKMTVDNFIKLIEN